MRAMEGDVAVVTGGTRGIGLEIVRDLASNGVRTVYCGRDEHVGVDVQRAFAADGLDTHFVACDIGVDADVQSLVREAEEKYGTVAILVNNAGVNANYDATTMTEDEWDRFFATDLKAAWLASKYVIPGMKRRGGGSIVNVSSLHAFATLEGFFPYAAAKSGLIGLTRSLALDYGVDNIRVNCIAPGFIRTRLSQSSIDRAEDKAAAEARMVAGVAMKRIGEPGEIATVVTFFASSDSSYVTGSSLLVDGGLTARRAG